jgi:hypothetical protein
MNSRQRLRETFRYGKPDRVPYFEETIRGETLDVWLMQDVPFENYLYYRELLAECTRGR